METDQTVFRIGSFVCAFALCVVLEIVIADRERKVSRGVRWFSAFGLLFVSGALVKLMLPLGLASIAEGANANNIGLLNQDLDLPFWISAGLSFVVMDLAIWVQHWATHKIPFLWRLHRVHHADPDVDVTTAFRFHPIEIALSLGWKIVVILTLGIHAEVVFWFEIVLNASAQFNHANIKLPKWIENAIRPIIVTPAMHRIHHSVQLNEQNSNYGSFLSIWDRVFEKYTAQFSGGESAPIGLLHFQSTQDQRLDQLLLQPFVKTE